MERETLVSRKAVFDAMVFLQAVANPSGPSGACFARVRSGALALITSPQTVAELRGLLARPNIRKKFPHLTDEAAEKFIAEIERISTSVENVPRAFEYPRDPKDEPYVNLAIIVEFRQRYPTTVRLFPEWTFIWIPLLLTATWFATALRVAHHREGFPFSRPFRP